MIKEEKEEQDDGIKAVHVAELKKQEQKVIHDTTRRKYVAALLTAAGATIFEVLVAAFK